MNEHAFYLNRCLELAQLAAAEGETAVGCVIVKNGAVIGEGYEKSKQLKDVTRHAEVVAILDAVAKHGDCKGATLYSNMEPCILCAYVLRHHQLAEVVFSNYCGELGGSNPKFNILGTNDILSWTKAPTVLFLG